MFSAETEGRENPTPNLPPTEETNQIKQKVQVSEVPKTDPAGDRGIVLPLSPISMTLLVPPAKSLALMTGAIPVAVILS